MLSPALRDPDPVLIFEHGSLYNLKGALAADAGAVDIDRAAVRRAGDDVTLITYGGSLGKALEAADLLAADGISAEVIDLRTLRPLDDATILGVGAPHPPRRRRRRGLAQRQPLRRDQRPDHRAGVLRPRRPGRAGLHRRGADALRRSTSRRPRCPSRRPSPRPPGGRGSGG